MSLPAWWGTSLPCGCVRGVKLCSTAAHLWDAVADAHKPLSEAFARQGPMVRLQADYDGALAAFSAHVEIEAETAVQATML